METRYAVERIEEWRPESEHVYEGVYRIGEKDFGIVGVMNLVNHKSNFDMTSEVHSDLQAFRKFLKIM